MRRLPIFFVLDVSESMVGENLRHLAVVLDNIFDDFAKSQHAHDGAALNDHQRAHVLFGHGRHGLGQAIVRLDDVQGAAFDAQDIANFHGIALFCKIFTYQST